MILTEFFEHLRALGFYDDLREGAREALRLDLHGRGYLLITDDALRIPDGTKPIFVGLYALDGRQLDARMYPTFRSVLTCVHRLMADQQGKAKSAEQGS